MPRRDPPLLDHFFCYGGTLGMAPGIFRPTPFRVPVTSRYGTTDFSLYLSLSLSLSHESALTASRTYTKTAGSTTVAATMLLAELAGIRIFVTGGIGGVHRGAETTFDISADLIELGKTQVSEKAAA